MKAISYFGAGSIVLLLFIVPAYAKDFAVVNLTTVLINASGGADQRENGILMPVSSNFSIGVIK